jgi:WD40 repeat protein
MLRNRLAWRTTLALGGSAWVFLSGCGQGEDLAGPAPPALQITTVTGGPGSDPDGYTVALDGHAPVPVASQDTLVESDVAAGDHSVDLAGVASGCTVEGGPSRSVVATAGITVSVAFNVTCAAPEPVETGVLRVSSSTSGVDLDPNGYIVAVDPGESRSIGLVDEVRLEGVLAGTRSVRLSGLADNCGVQGDNPVTAEVPADGEVAVAFVVRCWPPPAGRIVFARAEPPSILPDRLEVIGADGEAVNEFLLPIANNPSLSPDGSSIAFIDDLDVVWVQPTSGSGAVELSGCKRSAPRPVWSPDGTRVLCLTDAVFGGELWSIRRDGSDPRPLAPADLVVRKAYYSAGGQVLFVADDPPDPEPQYSLYRAGTTTASPIHLFRFPNDIQAGFEPVAVPSPDGSRVAYTRFRAGGEVWVANLDGGTAQLISSTLAVSSGPVWSPDGSRIAFLAVDTISFVSKFSTWMVNPDGSALTRVPLPPAPGSAMGTWSPDGSRLVLSIPRENAAGDFESSIYMVRADGSGLQRLTATSTYDVEPAWGP